MTESLGLKTAAEAALTEWEEICGLGPTGSTSQSNPMGGAEQGMLAGNIRQGLRLLQSRLQSAAPLEAESAAEGESPEAPPTMEIWIDEKGVHTGHLGRGND